MGAVRVATQTGAGMSRARRLSIELVASVLGYIKAGKYVVDIARAHDISDQSVRMIARRYNINPAKPPPGFLARRLKERMSPPSDTPNYRAIAYGLRWGSKHGEYL
jgi:hypothetical protein